MNQDKKLSTFEISDADLENVSGGVSGDVAIRRCRYCKKEYVPTIAETKKHGEGICTTDKL